MNPLDRPAWASLTSTHAHIAEGNALAWRYPRNVNVFAAARDHSPAALAALAALAAPGEAIYLLEVPDITLPPTLHCVKQARCLQLVATRAVPAPPSEADTPWQALGDTHAAEMLALARLTQPGPFAERTHTLGNFIGVFIDGRLAAMAGERLRFDGWSEVSGVCTHPDFRGRGLARQLSAAIAARIQARGEQAFLHAWPNNEAALALYKDLGFQIRAEVNVAVLEAPAPQG